MLGISASCWKNVLLERTLMQVCSPGHCSNLRNSVRPAAELTVKPTNRRAQERDDIQLFAKRPGFMNEEAVSSCAQMLTKPEKVHIRDVCT